MEKERVFNLKMSKEMWRQVRDVAHEDVKSMAEVVREGIVRYMELRRPIEK